MMRLDLFYFVIWVVCMFLLLLFSIMSPFVHLISPPSLPPSISLSLSRDNRWAPLLCHFSGRQPLIHVPIIPSAQGAIGAGHKRHKQSSISLSSLCSRPPPRLQSLSPPLLRLSFCRASTVGRALSVFPLHPPYTYHSSPASSFLLLIGLLFVSPLCLQSLQFFSALHTLPSPLCAFIY